MSIGYQRRLMCFTFMLCLEIREIRESCKLCVSVGDGCI